RLGLHAGRTRAEGMPSVGVLRIRLKTIEERITHATGEARTLRARLADVIEPQRGSPTWSRRAALGVFGVWGVVSLVRLSRLAEPPEPPPGQELAPMLEFLRATIPADAGYLFVLPGEFGADTGTAPRIRYELYPRAYDDVRASADEA